MVPQETKLRQRNQALSPNKRAGADQALAHYFN
jgi:hypothetical protein